MISVEISKTLEIARATGRFEGTAIERRIPDMIVAIDPAGNQGPLKVVTRRLR